MKKIMKIRPKNTLVKLYYSALPFLFLVVLDLDGEHGIIIGITSQAVLEITDNTQHLMLKPALLTQHSSPPNNKDLLI